MTRRHPPNSRITPHIPGHCNGPAVLAYTWCKSWLSEYTCPGVKSNRSATRWMASGLNQPYCSWAMYKAASNIARRAGLILFGFVGTWFWIIDVLSTCQFQNYRLPSPGHLRIFFKGLVMNILEYSFVGAFPGSQHFKGLFGLSLCLLGGLLVKFCKIPFDQVCHP
jgi:hypothetical protein